MLVAAAAGRRAPMTRVMTVVGTRPEIIRLSRVIDRLDRTVDHVLVHTGQNWDHDLSDVFFDELGLRTPDPSWQVDTSSLGRVLGGVLVGTERGARRTCGPTRCSCWATPTAASRR